MVLISETEHRFTRTQGEYAVDGFQMYYFYGREYLERVHQLPLHPGDVILATYPRSGTTFTQRVISGLKWGPEAIRDSGFDLFQHFPHVELNYQWKELVYRGYETAVSQEPPRFIKTHLPLSVAPKMAISGPEATAKVLFALRNPRDVLVSLFHFHESDETLDFRGRVSFEEFFHMFLEGCVINGDWWEYNSQWLAFCRENPRRTLVITYEGLLQHFEHTASQVGLFLGLPHDQALVAEVRNETKVEKMRGSTLCQGVTDFVRKGVSGDWRNHFSEEQTAKFDAVVAEKKKTYPRELFDLIGE